MYRTAMVAARPENLNGGAPALFQVVDYYTSMFVWRGLDNLGGEIGEATFASWGYTEHAYNDPENCADRFAPQGLDFDEANWLFYGLESVLWQWTLVLVSGRFGEHRMGRQHRQ